MKTERNKRHAVSDMGPPSKSFTNMLMVNRVLNRGMSVRNRREEDRKNINKYGQSYSLSHFNKLHHQNALGKYGPSAFALRQTIERSHKRAAEAAKAKVEAEAALQREALLQRETEAALQREALLQQKLGRQQSAGNKKKKSKNK
jgi:hypothetical protein